MKRHWLCLIAIVVLSSCTPVEDFGPYWDRGFADITLEGTWEKLGVPGQKKDDTPGPDRWQFTRDGSSYLVRAINPGDASTPPATIAQRKIDNERRMSARTLRIGQQLFLMYRDPAGGPGTIVRYDVQNGVLQEHAVKNYAAVAFLKAKYPGAKNIGKNAGEGEYVVIRVFDPEAFKALSEIADNPAFWYLSCQYPKLL